MNEKGIEPQLVRDWVYQALKKPFSFNTPSLEDVLLSVYHQACQQSYLQPRMNGPILAPPSIVAIPPDLQNDVRGVIWDLIIQGIIVPGVPNQMGSSGLPAFVLTDWGKKCLENQEHLPYDAAKYIEGIRERIPAIDNTVLLYLKEALASFRVGAYLSSAVMTGVASEKVLLLLRDGLEAALRTPDLQKKFAAATKGMSISRVYQEIWKRLEPNQEALANHLCQEDIKVELSGIFDMIRKTRNDAGHPTGREISRDEADSILHLFPVYCKTAYATMDWLSTKPFP